MKALDFEMKKIGSVGTVEFIDGTEDCYAQNMKFTIYDYEELTIDQTGLQQETDFDTYQAGIDTNVANFLAAQTSKQAVVDADTIDLASKQQLFDDMHTNSNALYSTYKDAETQKTLHDTNYSDKQQEITDMNTNTVDAMQTALDGYKLIIDNVKNASDYQVYLDFLELVK